MVNEPLADDVYCLDIEGSSRRRPSDDQVWKLIMDQTGATNSTAFNKLTFVATRHSSSELDSVLAAPKVQQLDKETKNNIMIALRDKGASLRQIERLTGTFRLRYEQRKLVYYAMP